VLVYQHFQRERRNEQSEPAGLAIETLNSPAVARIDKLSTGESFQRFTQQKG